jgi:nitrite reductase (NADH) large subunit
MRHYVLIGMGAAGVAAAEAIRYQDPSGSIQMISDESYGYYSRPGLAYYLSGELPESQLYPFNERDFHKLNVQRLNGRVQRIDPRSHRVQLRSGAVLPYDRLLIATGASAVRLKAPGVEAAGVVKLDNLDDAHIILKLARKARSAVVIGGGITALELTEGLLARGVKVHYLLRGDRYWSNVLDGVEAEIVEQRLIEDGAQIHYRTELEEILQPRGRVEGVRTKDGRTIRCEIVAYAIGVQPRKELAEVSGIRTERGIIVNENLQTSQVDIFSAGDVAQVYDACSGESLLNTLWTPARDQGRLAGLNMAGRRTAYCKPIAVNVTRLANLTTTIIGKVGGGSDSDLYGIARGDSETFRQLPEAIVAQSGFDVNRLRLMVGQDRLLGAIVMGDQTLSHLLQDLIIQEVDISSIRDLLLQPDAPLADILADFWATIRQAERYAAQPA